MSTEAMTRRERVARAICRARDWDESYWDDRAVLADTDAAITAYDAALAEEGMVIVPGEPTEAMKFAAGLAGDKGFSKVYWRAMIAAWLKESETPSPPTASASDAAGPGS